MSSHSPTTRMTALDGFRGVAAISVLLFHAGPLLIPMLAPNLMPGGFLGVDLFFVLSGFLMTNILLEPGRSFGRFYARRIARIFPALYVFLAAQFLYSSVVSHGSVGDLRVYPLIALGLGNWGSSVGIVLPWGLGQTWSLGVEEQLYLLWPLVLVLFGRTDPRRLRILCAAGIILSMVLKLAMFRAGVSTVQIYGQTEGRLDDFLAGALVAAVWQSGFRPLRGIRPLTYMAAAFLGVCLFTAHPYTSKWLYEGGSTAIAMAAGLIVYACLLGIKETTPLGWRPLRSAGRYSYSMYLWHPLIFLAVDRSIPGQPGVRILWATGLLLAACVISTLCVEEPLRRVVANMTTNASRRKQRRLALASSA